MPLGPGSHRGLLRSSLLLGREGLHVREDGVWSGNAGWRVFIVGHVVGQRNGELIVERSMRRRRQGLGEHVGAVLGRLDISRGESALAYRLHDVVMA